MKKNVKRIITFFISIGIISTNYTLGIKIFS